MHWISVEERLPKDHNIIVEFKGPDRGQGRAPREPGYFCGNYWISRIDAIIFDLEEITHWRETDWTVEQYNIEKAERKKQREKDELLDIEQIRKILEEGFKELFHARNIWSMEGFLKRAKRLWVWEGQDEPKGTGDCQHENAALFDRRWEGKNLYCFDCKQYVESRRSGEERRQLGNRRNLLERRCKIKSGRHYANRDDDRRNLPERRKKSN